MKYSWAIDIYQVRVTERENVQFKQGSKKARERKHAGECANFRSLQTRTLREGRRTDINNEKINILILPLRPILMIVGFIRSQLQKVSFSTYLLSHDKLLPRKCWELVFLASECVGVPSEIYLEAFLAS